MIALFAAFVTMVFNALTHQRSFTKATQRFDISRTQVSKLVQQLHQRRPSACR
ncbi:hypothetical protein ACQKPX_10075 [Photobacterium sp. DNB23_23_1]